MEQSATGIKPGSHLGSYTVLKQLSQGGMSLVYLGEHSSLGRLVAIKVLRAELADSPEAVQRFFLEARAVNQLRHPHIVDIIDFVANEGGEAYYIMEFLEGLDTEQLVTRHQMPLLRALEVARQAAQALTAVHDAGIVHRDFKCGNVFVTTDGDGNDWVKLIDFGLAKLDDPHGRRIGDTLDGVAAGTPEFMSPEQLQALPVDHRSDIYSFGVFLYQLVTGRVPFHGDAIADTARMHLHDKPKRPRKVNRAIPKALDKLIMQCLHKKPNDRPQHMKDIQPDLALIADALRYDLSIRARRRWRIAFALTTLFALVAGSLVTDALNDRPIASTLVSLRKKPAPPPPPAPASQPASYQTVPPEHFRDLGAPLNIP